MDCGSSSEDDEVKEMLAMDSSDDNSDEDIAIGNMGAWTRMKAGKVTVSIDDVDRILYDEAHSEMKALLSEMARGMGLKRVSSTGKLKQVPSIQDITSFWLDPAFLSRVLKHINDALDDREDKVSAEEFGTFLKVEMLLCFYGTSPEMYFKEHLRNAFGRGNISEMSKTRFGRILRALEGTRNTYDPNSWKEPFQYDKDLQDMQHEVRSFCAKWAYTGNVKTTISADDDQLRIRSLLAEQVGLVRIKNSMKGFGPVFHGIVSLCTNMFLGGVVAGRGMSAEKCMMINLQDLKRVPLVSMANFKGLTTYCFDRGYSHMSLVNAAVQANMQVLGTVKRRPGFPFTYGEVKQLGRGQKWVSEKGEKSIYCAQM